jgi:MFS transporter, FSR family, fosmidomycin resistance protein
MNPLLALLSFSHMAADIVQGALPALLPFLKDRYGLSYAASGALLMAAHLTSSGIQPLFGYFTDRRPLPALMPIGCLVSGLGIALLPFAPSLPWLVAVIIVLGLGTAAFHPEGFKATAAVVQERRATGMSFFSVGGNLGFAIGAPAALYLVSQLGLVGTVGLALPCLVATVLLVISLPALSHRAAAVRAARTVGPSRRPLYAISLIVAIVVLRSWAQLGLSAFIPFLYRAELDRNPEFVATLLFLFLGAGTVGTLLGGPLADRVGHRRMLFGSLLLQVPLITAFLQASGVWVFILACAVGATIVSTFSVTIVMAQELFPQRMATASGVIAGFAIGTGGVGVTLLGAVADRYGLPVATHLIVGLPAVGAFFAFLLPLPWKSS